MKNVFLSLKLTYIFPISFILMKLSDHQEYVIQKKNGTQKDLDKNTLCKQKYLKLQILTEAYSKKSN